MHRNPPAEAYPYAGDLAVFNPHAGEAFAAPGGDFKVGKGRYEGFFQKTEVYVQIPAIFLQIENGITHKLSWSVIGSLPASIDFKHRMGKSGGFSEAALIPRPADCVDRGVFHQEYCSGSHALLDFPDVFFLKMERVLIGDIGSEPAADHDGKGI